MNIIYAIGIKRVSSTKQGLMGDSPKDQEDQIIRRSTQLSDTLSSEIVLKKWFEFTESASRELNLQPILKALEYCKNPKNKIQYAFIKSIDRGTRGGATIYGQLKAQFALYGVQFVDVYGVISTQKVNTLDHLGIKFDWSEFSPSWITELLEAERAKGDVRDILTRLIGAEIRYVRMGYRVRPPSPGYKNVKVETVHGIRTVLEPHETEGKWFKRMFELRIQGNLSDVEIVKEINTLGYKSRKQKIHDPTDKTRIVGYRGEKPLTVKQFQRYISNPIYAGINIEKWTEGKPIKAKFSGIITIDEFNKANRGKITIIDEGETVKIYRGAIPEWRKVKNKENPLYPYKKYVLCSFCHSPYLGSASRGQYGNRHPAYHCSRGHKYHRIPLASFHKTIEDFVKNVEFTETDYLKLRQRVLNIWEERQSRILGDSKDIHIELARLTTEEKMLVDKIKVLTSTIAIHAMEAELDEIQKKKLEITNKRDQKEYEEVNTQLIINYFKYYMEHFEELLLGGSDPLQRGAMFGILFDELPTYEDLTNGTVKLACLFKLKNSPQLVKSQSVSLLSRFWNTCLRM